MNTAQNDLNNKLNNLIDNLKEKLDEIFLDVNFTNSEEFKKELAIPKEQTDGIVLKNEDIFHMLVSFGLINV